MNSCQRSDEPQYTRDRFSCANEEPGPGVHQDLCDVVRGYGAIVTNEVSAGLGALLAGPVSEASMNAQLD